jgi:sigma-B regulation protein RsbU (phosphoserine phosphatase)
VATATFDRVRADLEALDDAVTGELSELESLTDRARTTAFAIVIASFAANLLMTVAVTLLFRRWVLRPLGTISGAARQLATDETTALPDFEVAELQDVTDAIRTMQGSLADARDRAVTAYEGLAQSAVLALHVRSQLSNELGELPLGWEVESMLEPATGVVAGDCYDVGLLTPTTVYAVVVDVTGHGAIPALDALKAKSQLRAALRSRLEPGDAIGWLAREREADPEADLMTTAVAVIDLESGECRYANAGHPPLLVLTDGAITQYTATGPLLGAFTASWQTRVAQIPPGGSLVIYTDGITDSVGEGRQRFGDERMLDALRSADGSAVAAVEAVREAVEEFRVGPRFDDLTMLVVRRTA